MRQFAKGDEVEVRSGEGMLKEWWHLAWIVGCHGDSYCVYYSWKVNGVDTERVPAERIRPRPPAVEFSNWSRGDLVQVYDPFVWKLATVTAVFEESVQHGKLFMVSVLGSDEDLVVRAVWARVRHIYDRQRDTWTIVGKGPYNNHSQQKERDSSGRAMATKRSAPGEAEAGRGLKRICTTDAAALDCEKQDDSSGISSSGSCSVNSDHGSSERDDYVSDAESCTGPSLRLCLSSLGPLVRRQKGV